MHAHLILGHMPLVGVSYQSKKKDEEYHRRFKDLNNIKDVLDTAIKLNITKFAAASPDSSVLASLHLQALKETINEGYMVELIPCVGIPMKLQNRGIEAFRRWATMLAFEKRLFSNVKERILSDPILNFREGWKERLPISKTYTRKDFQRLSVDWKKLEQNLDVFIDLPVCFMEPGSETDFLAMTKRFDLLGDIIDRIKDRGFKGVLFGVHHAGITIPLMDNELVGFDGFITPLNPLGLMMFPSKASSEKAVSNTKKQVFAIKILAGGRVKPEEAFEYVSRYKINGCMIGCASVSEVLEDFEIAKKILMDANR